MARTRSESAHRKVLDAALELVAERGIEATSMDAIAAQSGVSKATIYKHWKDKESLVLEMLAMANGLTDRPSFDSGDIRRDMVDVLAYRPPGNSETRERLTPHLIAYSAANREFGLAWRNVAMDPPRRELRRLIRSAVRKRELRANVDEEMALAVLLGPILYWFVFLKRSADDPRPLAQVVVDTFWRANSR